MVRCAGVYQHLAGIGNIREAGPVDGTKRLDLDAGARRFVGVRLHKHCRRGCHFGQRDSDVGGAADRGLDLLTADRNGDHLSAIRCSHAIDQHCCQDCDDCDYDQKFNQRKSLFSS